MGSADFSDKLPPGPEAKPDGAVAAGAAAGAGDDDAAAAVKLVQSDPDYYDDGGGGGDAGKSRPRSPHETVWATLASPLRWFRMMADQMHWSFVAGVVVVYGVSQGLGGSLFKVSSDYYWKDVQRIQPSASQFYQGVTSFPWIIKPVWGLLTDVLPIAGYRRRPYFLLAGALGVISMLIVSVHKNLHVFFALVLLTAGSAGVAIADVTIDACVAQNSITLPSLAADMQSLCGLSSSIGGLLGFAISGLLLHLMGSQGVLGSLCIPSALVFLVGILLKEAPTSNFSYSQIHRTLREATRKMLQTLKCPEVWKPCLYMYLSLAVCFDVHEGLFYWYTDPKAGPAFSQEAVGFIYSIGSVGSLLAVLLYQNVLKDYSFHTLLFWTQLFFALAGMLALVLVLRINLKLGVPDYVFVVFEVSVVHLVGRLKWMPLLVLSSKLCPSGIEGTFFALLMSIDNIGLLTASWGGGLLLHLLKVSRTNFTNLWLTVLIRSLMRLIPLALLFLIPKSDPNSNLLPEDILDLNRPVDPIIEKDIELISLVDNPL